MLQIHFNRTKSNLQVIKVLLLIILYSSLVPTCLLKSKAVHGKRFVIHVPMKIRTHHHIHTVYTQMHGKEGTGGGGGGGGGNGASGGSKGSKQQTIYKIMGYSTHHTGLLGGGVNEGGGGKRGIGQHYGRHGHHHHHHSQGNRGGGGYGEINYDDYTNCDSSLPHAGDMIFNHYSRQDEEDYPDVEEEIIDDDEQENIRINTSLNNTTLEVTSSGGGGGSSTSGNGCNNTLENSSSASSSAVVISHRQRFATLSCINGSNVNNVEDDNNGINNEDANIIDNNNQFIVNRHHYHQQHYHQQRRRPFLCRTPPPNYPALPLTPPPSYTPRQQQPELTVRLQENSRDVNVNNGVQQEQSQHQHHRHQQQQTLRSCQVPEALGLPHEGQVAQNRLNVERNIVNEPVVVNRQVVGLANGSYQTRNVATVSHQHQQQQQQQQRLQQQIQQSRRKQRRRRLHLLHQQQNHRQLQQSLSVNNNFTDSENSTSFTDTSESDHDISIGTTRDQRRRRRQRLLKLRDAYCPDLLNACSLILLQQQTSDSTVGSFTDTPPERLNDTSDYVEIDELQQRNLLRNHQQPYKTQSLSQIYETLQRRTITYNSHYNRLNGVKGREEQRQNGKEDEEENQRLYYNNKQKEMGQNLSIRRPRISLTWVLREQSQQQQQPQQNQSPTKSDDNSKVQEVVGHEQDKKESRPDLKKILNNNHHLGNGSTKSEVNHNQLPEKKRYRLKHIPGNTEPLNGYATTPTGYTNTPTALGSQKFFSNQNLLEYHKDDVYSKPASKDLLFVCTPQRVPDSFGGSMDALALAKKRNEIRKKLASKMAHFRSESQTPRLVNNISNCVQLKKDTKSTLKCGSYSEPSLIAASEGNSRRHRHRKRRERTRGQKFGYDIKNVDEFLNKCSLASPGNIPMVLSTSCILYQTRPGGYQTEISLPLGMVVNAVFKNQNWLYVQTPHAEEGYVNYNTCLPLGILPPEARKEGSSNSKPTPCWETNGDIFPKPCGNMTDSEKEIHLRVGSRSEGARTPHLKNPTTDNDTVTVVSVKTDNTDCLNGNANGGGNSSLYGEQQVDKLYLRAASQPKLTEKTSYAQLKIIRNHSSAKSQSSSYHTQDEYVTLKQQQQQLQQQQNKSMQKHVHHIQSPQQQKTYITRTFITNGHNGQHLHPKDMKTNIQQQQQQTTQQQTNCNLKAPTTVIQQNNASTTTITVTSYTPPNNQQLQKTFQQSSQSSLQHNPHHHHTVAPRAVLNAIRRSSAHCGQRQTLVAITTDYTTDVLTLHKGDIVTLCECRETKDHRQWFYVRTRDGRQGYIPAEVAGHGYL